MFKTIKKEVSKGAKKANHEIDKGTKALDANVSKAVDMPEGTKVSHSWNTDSSHHKDAVKHIKGEESPIESTHEDIAGNNTSFTDEV